MRGCLPDRVGALTFLKGMVFQVSELSQKQLLQEAERHADKGHMTKTANFQNPRWRTAAVLKIIKSPHLSETVIGF